MIDKFEGEYAFLSNFHPSPFWIGGNFCKSVEHGYQAYKATNDAEFEAILNAQTPGEAKKLGRKCIVDPDWELKKDRVMVVMLVAKYCNNPDLAQKLVDTGDQELVEGNWWGDTYWGVCKGVGHNMLGKLLMIIREDIKTNGVDTWCETVSANLNVLRPQLEADMHELDDGDEDTRL